MNDTWHFKLPETLLQPSTDRLATQQGLSTLTTPNIQSLLTLFETFSAYADLPLGLNPRRRKALRQELYELKTNPKIYTSEIARLVKKIKTIKEDYRQRKVTAHKNQQSIFTTYSNEDLSYVSMKLLNSIEIYIINAKNEIKRVKPKQEKIHPLPTFKQFIEYTEAQLQKHRRTIVECMLARLQEADKENTLDSFSYDDFMMFHAQIQKHGDPQMRVALGTLSWIKNNPNRLRALISPKKPRTPWWLFYGSYIIYKALGNSYYQISLTLKAKQLKSINPENLREIIQVETILQNLNNEIERLTKLQKSLFKLIHRSEYRQLTQRLKELHQYQKEAKKLKNTMQLQLDLIKKEQEQKQEKRNRLLERIKKYDAESVEHFQKILMKRIPTSTPDEFSEIQALVTEYGDKHLKSIWIHYLDHYRLTAFSKVIFDAEHSEALLAEFLYSLKRGGHRFPATDAVDQQLHHLIHTVPTPDWTEHQHQACESVNSHLVLREYYLQAMNFHPLADTIIQRFAEESFTEIEFPELKAPLEKLIQKRLLEKEAAATANLIKSEIEQENVDFACDQLNRLQYTLQDTSSKQKLILVSQALVKTAEDPEALSQQLLLRLKNLINRSSKTSTYLEEFSQLKSLAETLPYSQKYASIKRLCTAGPNIPYLFSELPNAILALAGREIEYINLINPLLLDIIDADLIYPEKKQLILQLIDAALIDSQNTLPTSEKYRLASLKNCLSGVGKTCDRAVFINPLSKNPNRLRSVNTFKNEKPPEGNQYEPRF